MYAQIPQAEISNKGHLLEVDKVYVLSKFTVTPAKTAYIPFNARFMIHFTSFTEIVMLNQPLQSFPSYIYTITLFNEIRTTPDAINKYIGTY